MSYEIVKTEENRTTVRFTEAAADVDKAFAGIRSRIGKELRIPGFRPGHIPRSILDSRFGNLVRAEVAELVRERAVEAIIDEKDWLLAERTPGGDGQLPSEAQDYIYELTFSLFTTPAPRDYAGVEIRLPRFDREGAIDRTLDSIKEKLVTFEPAERPAGRGDLVLVEATQETAAGTQPERMALRLGEDNLGPGLDRILEGMSAGAAFTARISLPPDKDGEQPAEGKPTSFLVHQVREPRYPELDDELAKKAGGCDTMAEFRGKLGERLSVRWEEERGREMEDQALSALLEGNQFEPPAYMVENLRADLLEEMKGKPGEDTGRFATELASAKVREFLVLRAIAGAEGLEPSEEEIAVEAAKSTSRSAAIDRLRNRMALEFVLGRAVVTEVEPQAGDGEKPAESGPEWGWKVCEAPGEEKVE